MKAQLISLFIICVMIQGCSIQAPHYQASYNNVKLLNNTESKLSVDRSKTERSFDSLAIRGSNLRSPYGQDFHDYLETAIIAELSKAQIYDKLALKKLTFNVIELELFTPMTGGYGIAKVNFEIDEAGKIIYSKTKEVKHDFPSSFMGAIAITNAQLSFPKLIEKLLSELYSDADFINAL